VCLPAYASEFYKLSDEEKYTIRQQHGFEVVGPALTHEK